MRKFFTTLLIVLGVLAAGFVILVYVIAFTGASQKPQTTQTSQNPARHENASSGTPTQQRRPLTQSEINTINAMEKEWARSMDLAGPLMARKKYSEAAAPLKNSLRAVGQIIEIAQNHGATEEEIQKMDRIIGMRLLSQAYINLNQLLPWGDNLQDAAQNIQPIQAQLQETNELLKKAESKFSEIPPLQNLCRQLFNELVKLEKILPKN